MKTFSLISNLRTFLKTDGTPAGMESLNGIRVITIIWLILGHENFMTAPAISKYFQTYLFDMFHSHSVLPYVCFHVAENVLDVRPRLAKSFGSQLIVQWSVGKRAVSVSVFLKSLHEISLGKTIFFSRFSLVSKLFTHEISLMSKLLTRLIL